MADSFFAELRRRNVFKVGVAYLVLAWVVVQVTDSAVPALHLPEWVNSLVFYLGTIGFPFALFFAWAFEITPEGIKKESEITPEESITAHTGRKLDFIIIGLLAVGMGYFIYESRFESEPEEEVVAQNNTSKAEPLKEAKKEPEGSSIAVLPFVNMSDDASNEYFSDGISEEILNVLAKLPNLKVTSRSSAFFYKGKDIKISEVAKELGVLNILEGSVRKAGNRIRITAQLIEAGTDTHLWSETYDRELSIDNLFAIQDEISAAIVEALKSKLGLDVKITTRDMSKVNLDAHNEYLQGRFYVEKRTKQDLDNAILHFDKAIELQPDYAIAWAGKGLAIILSVEHGNLSFDEAAKRSEYAANKALSLNPDSPEAFAVMGLIYSTAYNNIEKAASYYQKAYTLNPNYADAYAWHSLIETDSNKKLELVEKALELNPLSLKININYAETLRLLGRLEESTKVLHYILSIDSTFNLAYSSLGGLLEDSKQGEAGYYFYKAHKINPSFRNKLFLMIQLANLGLSDLAKEVFLGSRYADSADYYLNNQLDLYIKEGRKIFPISDSDIFGNRERGRIEAFDGNYKKAIHYLKQSLCTNCDELIFSYLQIGDTESAELLLEERKNRLQAGFKSGLTGKIIEEMQIALLEGNLELAIQHLKKAMDNGYILKYYIRIEPTYEKLRQHSEWSEILAESNRRVVLQQDIYLKMVAENEKTNL